VEIFFQLRFVASTKMTCAFLMKKNLGKYSNLTLFKLAKRGNLLHYLSFLIATATI